MNGIIVIDKPEGWTSHDVVGKLRSILKERRIGHGGTLDPMATGVLPVFIGRATRAVEFCESADKEYIAGLRLGITTDTQDITGNVVAEQVVEVTEDRLVDELSRFSGKILQIPPMYSAVKIDGRKLYEIARRGGSVERAPREITVHSIKYLGRCENGGFLLDIVCSKGTYIRTLCNDIGDSLGCGGVMSSLRRTRAGIFTEDEAVTIEKVMEYAAESRLDELMIPVDVLFSDYGKTTVPDKTAEKSVKNGGGYDSILSDGRYRVYSLTGDFLMLGEVEKGKMKTVKSFFEVK